MILHRNEFQNTSVEARAASLHLCGQTPPSPPAHSTSSSTLLSAWGDWTSKDDIIPQSPLWVGLAQDNRSGRRGQEGTGSPGSTPGWSQYLTLSSDTWAANHCYNHLSGPWCLLPFSGKGTGLCPSDLKSLTLPSTFIALLKQSSNYLDFLCMSHQAPEQCP